MPESTVSVGRADAQRNRQRLVDAALAAFSTGDDAVTLESIAKRAGVGIGTLYRHFPTREALVEEVYRTELAHLCDRAEGLAATLPPDTALRTWMAGYADFVTTKRGMADALRAIIATGAVSSYSTREQLTAAVRTLLDAGVEAGMLRTDIPAEDVVVSLAGIMLAAGSPTGRAQVDRLLDLLMDGLRVR